MTKTMKQVQLNQFGAPGVLQLMDVDLPQPRAGQVVVKVTAIGVNYADLLRRRNQYFQPTPLPYVLGAEAVGEIVAVGEGVTAPYVIGNTVLAILPSGGGYAEYVAAMAQYCVPLPPAISATAATAIFVQGTTAQLMISKVAGTLKDKTVLINAAAGGVGSILVQLARMQGAKVIAAAGTDEKLSLAIANGAAIGVNYSHANWSEKLMEATENKGVDIVFEMVGGEVYNASIESLAAGGELIVYGCASGVQGAIHPEYFVDKNISQSGFNLAHYISTKMPLWQEALGTVIDLLAKGVLKINTPNIFALKDAAEAHRQMEARQTTGKVILMTSN